ncbi:MAG: OmpA family protein [Gelidibacter sp.]
MDESKTFNVGKSYSFVNLPFGQYTAFGIRVKSVHNNDVLINSVLTADVRDEVKNKPHISIAVNKRRFRLWINEVKYVDIPQFIPDGNILKTIKFNLQNFKDGKERLFIQNVKIAEGGLDLRRTLMSEGRVSTNGILFDSGSANIKPQSLGIVMQISQVLLQDDNIKLNIVGHTDSDGSDEANMKLSKARAEAVKNALVTIYKISEDRLQTDGKGESVPVADNGTADGKAQNRRVEFIKI